MGFFTSWMIAVSEDKKLTPNIPLLMKGIKDRKKVINKLSQLEEPKYDLGASFDKLKNSIKDGTNR